MSHQDDRLPMIYHKVRQDRQKSATSRDIQLVGTANRIHTLGHGQHKQTADHGACADRDDTGDMGDIDLALMKENINKIRRRRIMKIAEASFMKRFSAVQSMTDLLKSQAAKVAREHAKTTQLITKLTKQVSEFHLASLGDMDGKRFTAEDSGDDADVEDDNDRSGDTITSKLPKLPNIVDAKTDSADTSMPSSLPRVFQIQNSEAEMFSKSKTNIIKRVAYKKSKINVNDQSHNRSEKIGSAKSASSEKRLPTQRSDKRTSKHNMHSAPSEHNTKDKVQDKAVKSTDEETKQTQKCTSSSVSKNPNKTEQGSGKLSKLPKPPKVKSTASSKRDGNKNSHCTPRTPTKDKPISRTLPQPYYSDSIYKANDQSKCEISNRVLFYPSDSSDSDESYVHDTRSQINHLQLPSSKDTGSTKKPRPKTGIKTARRRYLERQMRAKEKCIQQAGVNTTKRLDAKNSDNENMD